MLTYEGFIGTVGSYAGMGGNRINVRPASYRSFSIVESLEVASLGTVVFVR